MLRAPPRQGTSPPSRSIPFTLVLVWQALAFLFSSMFARAQTNGKQPMRIEYHAAHRPSHSPKANRRAPSLDGDPGSSDAPFRRGWSFLGGMLADWRWVWTEVGTALMVGGVGESAYQMTKHSFERSVHVHMALGFSKGLSLVFIVLVVLAQVGASVNLLVPTIYHTTGSIAPSTVLATTLWFEALLFGDMTDRATLVRTACMTLTAVMLALFRFDRQARNAMAQLPTSGTLLSIESRVRKLCTTARSGVVCPPLAAAVLLYNCYGNPFWRSHGIVYEWYHGRFQAGIAMSALLLLIAGQDTRAHAMLGDRLERWYDRFMVYKEDLLGQPRVTRWIGAKKSL